MSVEVKERIVEAKAEEVPAHLRVPVIVTGEKNPRGIPAAVFIEDVPSFLGESSTEVTIGALNELYGKYKYMESSFERNKDLCKSTRPDIEQTLELVRLLKAKRDSSEEMITNYSLSDTVYAKAKVDMDSDKVYLWIGASTMVEYSQDEAIELLDAQLISTDLKIVELDEDLSFLRGQCITVEVNMARLFNYGVKLKKLKELGTPALKN
jgi:prefoldin subunit 5